MIIYVDIDNTICNTEGTDYKNAIPIKERIEKIREEVRRKEDFHLVFYLLPKSTNN